MKAKSKAVEKRQTERSSFSSVVSSGLHPRKRPLFVRLLFHPMLYLAILAHGALLAVPGGPEEEVPPEVEEIETHNLTLED